ncbi:MAG: restriction endonuclease subunit S [Chloroflexi bacterium]|nr:restriction endonuclease subunit S [Chloroflexota bacterium]
MSSSQTPAGVEPIFGMLPENWTYSTLGQLVDLGSASLQTGPFGTNLLASEYKREGIPVIAVKNIGVNAINIDDDTPRVDEKTFRRLETYRIAEGDILFGRKGAVDRRAYVNISQSGCLQGSDCIRLRLDARSFDPKYVSYVLGTPQYLAWITQNAGGTTMPSLNQTILRRVPLPLPPLPIQREIAHILGTLDDKIDLNRKMNATLEAMARALFKSWFVDFDPVRAKAEGRDPAGMDAETAALFPDGFEDSPLGDIPRGWRVGTLGEVSEKPQYGYTASASDSPIGPKFLRITDINKAPWIDWQNVPYCEIATLEMEKYRLRFGDIVIARMADPGHGALVEEDVEAVFASYLIRFRPRRTEYARYLQYWLRSSHYWYIVDGFKTGTTRASLNAQVLSGFSLLVPDVRVAKAFDLAVGELRNKIVANNSESRTLAELRDALLPRLMRGELVGV